MAQWSIRGRTEKIPFYFGGELEEKSHMSLAFCFHLTSIPFLKPPYGSLVKKLDDL